MREGKFSGPPEEHFDRSQAAPACITSGKGQSVRFSTMGLISTRTGWGWGNWLVQTSLLPRQPFYTESLTEGSRTRDTTLGWDAERLSKASHGEGLSWKGLKEYYSEH